MYQSVFVIAEERRECVIATEVSQKKNHIFISISIDPPILNASCRPKCAIPHYCSDTYDRG